MQAWSGERRDVAANVILRVVSLFLRSDRGDKVSALRSSGRVALVEGEGGASPRWGRRGRGGAGGPGQSHVTAAAARTTGSMERCRCKGVETYIYPSPCPHRMVTGHEAGEGEKGKAEEGDGRGRGTCTGGRREDGRAERVGREGGE